jgi:hypothetical protein
MTTGRPHGRSRRVHSADAIPLEQPCLSPYTQIPESGIWPSGPWRRRSAKAWHPAVTVSDEQRIAVVESAATHRFGLAAWHHFYAARFPGQMRYRLPTKR